MLGAALSFNLVGVIEPDQARAVRRVHGHRVVQTVRFLRGHRHLMNDEAHPIACGINHQHLAMQV